MKVELFYCQYGGNDMKKAFLCSAAILTAFFIACVPVRFSVHAYDHSYKEYQQQKEKDYQSYQSEKEASYKKNRGKSYSERRKDYERVYEKNQRQREKTYRKYHS